MGDVARNANSIAMDWLLSKPMSFETLQEVIKRKSVWKEPEPGIRYKSQGYPRIPQTWTQYTEFKSVPFLDWDWPDVYHPDHAVTIRNMGDAVSSVADYASAFPDSRFRVYVTPGGMHAAEVTQPASAAEFFARPSVIQMNSDPNYASISASKDVFPIRTSAKPGRANDFVGWYLGDIGTGLPNPEIARQVRQHYDSRMAQFRNAQGMPAYGLNAGQQQLIQEQLGTVPRSILRSWGRTNFSAL